MNSFPPPKHSPVDFQIVEPGIALVTLNRPEQRNAVNQELAGALGRAAAEVDARDDIRAAIITGGEDRTFCAGADLREVAAGRLDELFLRGGGFAGFVQAPRAKPWIAAVGGPALAGGFEIVLACDLVVASDAARFGLPEVRRGLIASAGGLYRLPRALPRAIALELILTGETLSAGDAERFGLVKRVAEGATLAESALAIARKIVTCAPLAVRESVALARRTFDEDEATLSRMGDAAQARLQQTADYHEGALAFTEKRAPVWQGC